MELKRNFFVFLLVMLVASILIPAEASPGPQGRSHRRPHQVTCATQSAQESAYAWMNGLRGYGGADYTARFRRQTLQNARTEPGWFRVRVRRAARLQDRGRKQKAIGALWDAVEVNCR